MQERKKRALIIFSFIFIAYLSLIAYLVFFAPGLKFEIIEDKLYLKNESSHVINNIVVSAQDGSIIDCIDELKPAELVRIVLPVDRKINMVIARAPFHREAKREIVLEERKSTMLSVKVTHEKAVLGERFRVFLELCNKSNEDFFVKVEESHEQSFLKEENKIVKIGVKAQECKSVPYEFTPVKRGMATLNFSITGELFREKITESIEIK
ncbi:MAG: hypothetical protein J7L44_03495 [Candidatus Diapherotrites archaeon]|nr:hypothetical protein [Candidatus Diapherotrites archaeon]